MQPQPAERANAWLQLQSLKAIGTVPKNDGSPPRSRADVIVTCRHIRGAIWLLSCMKSRSSVSLSSNNLEAAT